MRKYFLIFFCTGLIVMSCKSEGKSDGDDNVQNEQSKTSNSNHRPNELGKYSIELAHLIDSFIRNFNNSARSWRVMADKKTSPIKWETRGINSYRGKKSPYVRRGETVIIVDGDYITRLGRYIQPATWDITMTGARSGVSKVRISSIVSQEYTGADKSYFESKGLECSRVEEPSDEYNTKYYKLATNDGSESWVKYEYSYGSAGTSGTYTVGDHP